MKKTSKKILFFGTENLSANSLKALIDAGYLIAAVITKPDSNRGRGKKFTEPMVKQIAKANNIEVWQPEKLQDIVPKIEAIDNRTGVLVSYGKIIPQNVLSLFEPIGIINLHPSLLPKYRGPSPIETAILNGDTKTGVSLIKLTTEMDAGPIYIQKETTIKNTENAHQLYETIASFGSKLLVNSLPEIIEEKLKPNQQEETLATYCKKIEKQDGEINWEKPAQAIDQEIRAYHNWPKSHTKIGNVEVIVRKAHVVPSNTNTPGKIESDYATYLCINSAKDSICIEKLQPLGKKEMPIRAFLAGYKNQIKQ